MSIYYNYNISAVYTEEQERKQDQINSCVLTTCFASGLNDWLLVILIVKLHAWKNNLANPDFEVILC